MEQLNNRIRSTRRMCFQDQIPCNMGDGGKGDGSEGKNLVPARFNYFSTLQSIALTHVDVGRLILGRCLQARFGSAGHFTSREATPKNAEQKHRSEF